MAPRAFPYVAQAPQAPQPAQTARKWQVTRNLHIPGPVYPAGAEGTQRPRIARSGREGLNDTHCCRALLLKAALERPRNEETRAAAGPRQLPNSGARCERGSAVAPTLFLVRPEDIPLRQHRHENCQDHPLGQPEQHRQAKSRTVKWSKPEHHRIPSRPRPSRAMWASRDSRVLLEMLSL